MNHLPVIALFFMSAVIFNCLRMLLNYSASLTLDVLVTGAVTSGTIAGVLAIFSLVQALRRGRRPGVAGQ
ncbi:hypothetical protein NXS97_00260 [Pantoea sp. B623]|uniref:hypothetical protein n=1 Tax=Pantoea sp. B623 TaxID=2974561 RepID=UPI0021695EB5|nr:hypothetical protein [Pantoea sp. B623]MCS4492646.1 hypothetical protein [Pantoea sp. B623]